MPFSQVIGAPIFTMQGTLVLKVDQRSTLGKDYLNRKIFYHLGRSYFVCCASGSSVLSGDGHVDLLPRA